MSTVRIQHDGPVTIVTIDRPEVRNAVDRATAEALADAFRAFQDDSERDYADKAGELSKSECGHKGLPSPKAVFESVGANRPRH